jgi:hypothetical protein
MEQNGPSMVAKHVGSAMIFSALSPPAATFYSELDPSRPYSYNSLVPGHIRLLKCSEHDESKSITFEFLTVSLDEAYDKFVAISYCWGSSSQDRKLPLTDGSHIMITENVEQLLMHIFAGDEDYIWLDAVCIDQQNGTEKAKQVGMMAKIYRSARRVSVWLGTPVNEIDEYRTIAMYAQEGCKASHKRDTKAIYDGLKWFAGLLNRPWWFRIWIVQEVCCGRNVWFHLGRLMMPWRYLESSFNLVEQINPRLLDEHSSGFPKCGDVVMQVFKSLRQSIESDHAMPLEHIYGMLSIYESTDPRDRVFAILSLASPHGPTACIVPDYGSDTREIFIHAMAAITAHTKDFALLELAGLATKRQIYNGRSLPSWVVDFASPPRDMSTFGAVAKFRTIYKASLNTKPRVWPGTLCEHSGDTNFYSNSTRAKPCEYHGSYCPSQPKSHHCPAPHIEILCVRGSKFDQIAGLGPEGCGYEPTVQALLHYLQEGSNIAKALNPYPTAESIAEIYWRTLCMNRVGADHAPQIPSASAGEEFKRQIQALQDAVNAGKGKEPAWKYIWTIKQMTHCTNGNIFHPQCYKRVFWTQKRYFGIALNDIKVSDSLWLVHGAPMPFIARSSRVGSRGTRLHQLVCEAYVHGVMQGEALAFDGVKKEFLYLE